jgi:hypothetical protein
MLWTDAEFITSADLASIDPDVTSTASAERMTFSGANSIIRRGIEEAGRYLEAALVSFATYVSSNDLSANHLNAVFYTGSQPNQRRRVGLDQIVISGRAPGFWSPIMDWAVNRCLITFYQAASSRAQGDRYEAKLKMYERRDNRSAWPLLKQTGVPIVYRPLPVPGAIQARDPGTWSATAVAAAGTFTGQYDVAITYVDQNKYISKAQPQNAESDGASVKTVTLTAGDVISVDISGLNPPYGAVPPDLLGIGFTVPGRASGWNLYVGRKGGTLYLQNATPYPITLTGASNSVPTLGGTTSATLASDPVLSGYTLGMGQYPEAHLTIPDLVERG